MTVQKILTIKNSAYMLRFGFVAQFGAFRHFHRSTLCALAHKNKLVSSSVTVSLMRFMGGSSRGTGVRTIVAIGFLKNAGLIEKQLDPRSPNASRGGPL